MGDGSSVDARSCVPREGMRAGIMERRGRDGSSPLRFSLRGQPVTLMKTAFGFEMGVSPVPACGFRAWIIIPLPE